MIVAKLSVDRDARRSVRALSGTPRPAAANSSRPPASICQTCLRSGSWLRMSSNVAWCAALSTMVATAPESPRFHWTCSAELVS